MDRNQKGFSLLIVVMIIISIGMVILAGCYVLQKKVVKITSISENKNYGPVLFEEKMNHSPCEDESGCGYSIKLYYSGELILKANNEIQKFLDQTTINSIVDKIKETNIMNKNCNKDSVHDVWGTTKINIDSEQKIVKYPSCEDEIYQIKKLLPLSENQ
jgi:hypothetical protein